MNNVVRQRNIALVLISIVFGLVLAKATMASLSFGIIFLASLILLSITVFLRRVDWLIVTWFSLTGILSFIMTRLLPGSYYAYAGRGIFWGILLCVIIAWALDKVILGKKFIAIDRIAAPLKVLAFLFVLWGIVTLPTSLDVFYSIRKLSHIVIALAASYMFYDFFSQDRKNVQTVLRILGIVVLFVSVVTVIVSVHGLARGLSIYKQISLWFHNPNTLGVLLSTSVPMLLSAGVYRRFTKTVKFFLGTLLLLALYFSFSRASWLAALVALSFLLWRSQLKPGVLASAVVGLFLVALLVPVAGQDVYEFIMGEQYSGRREIWGAAWEVASEHPLFGIGPGNWWAVRAAYVETPWLETQGVHSVYLKNAVEMGFLSVVLLFAFFGCFFWASLKVEKNLQSRYLKAVTRGSMATLLGLMAHGIFENGFLLTAFDAGEFTVLLPYIFMVLPFAAKNLEEAGK